MTNEELEQTLDRLATTCKHVSFEWRTRKSLQSPETRKMLWYIHNTLRRLPPDVKRQLLPRFSGCTAHEWIRAIGHNAATVRVMRFVPSMIPWIRPS
jgi:hypothetical protein